jgi:hypothetical protein
VSAGGAVWRREKVVEESSKKKADGLLERIRKGSFPPAAVAGALASFANAALGMQPKPASNPAANPSKGQIRGSDIAPVQAVLELSYSQSSAFLPRFRRSLAGIAIGAGDKIFILGDEEVRIFEHSGAAVRSWRAPESSSCITVGRDESVYIGVADRIEVFDSTGSHKQGFDAGEAGRPAIITAIKVSPKEILVADAAARYIRRYDREGKQIGAIGNQSKTGGFMLPNRSLDIDVDSRGVVVATDSGRHRVSSWTLDGVPIRNFGKFGLWNAEDFVGCCNPVNVAFAPGGRIVTAEKVVPRIKVYNTEGKLLGLIGPESFDPKCTHLHLAVDSKGRILVADPVQLEVKAFSVVGKSGGRENV